MCESEFAWWPGERHAGWPVPLRCGVEWAADWVRLCESGMAGRSVEKFSNPPGFTGRGFAMFGGIEKASSRARQAVEWGAKVGTGSNPLR